MNLKQMNRKLVGCCLLIGQSNAIPTSISYQFNKLGITQKLYSTEKLYLFLRLLLGIKDDLITHMGCEILLLN